MLSEKLYHLSDDILVLFQGFREDEDIIKVYHHYSFGDQFLENPIHHGLEVITVPHIVRPESSGLPRTTSKLPLENYMKIHIIFRWLFGGCSVAVRWLSHRTISPMDCPVNRHWTYA